MSTIVRDLRDEEEEEDEDGEDEDEGEESEDEDFVPNPASEDESDGEELTFDDDIAEVSTSGKAQAAGKKRRAAAAVGEAKTSKAAKTAKAVKAQKKKARAGGIFDEDDEQPAASTPVEGSASAETDPGAAKAEETAEVSAPAPEPAPAAPSGVDALWAELQGSSAPVRKPSKPASSGALDIKALLAKTGGASSSSVKGGGNTVQIKQTVDFCGEELTITKHVKAGSKEELAFKQGAAEALSKGDGGKVGTAGAAGGKSDLVSSAFAQSAELRRQMVPGVPSSAAGSMAPPPGKAPLRFDSSLEFKAALPPPKLPGVVAAKPSGLQGLLASIDGKKKLSTMEKSRHDWGNYKESQDEHT